ncbi:sensor domain-containing phosphodiesterase [Pectinatus haikarae]|uniref:sensor domain-containing phosphodiesterase n=1 Tax=Pectinatus haikarae TaxID=349096 RepID=UPI0018C62357|nr:sensor domain-containing phosphodiesterase [Pectinatus haikarae]
MESDQLLVLTEKLINEFYGFGRIEGILALLEEPVVGFSCHCAKYIIGENAFSEFLKNEYAYVNPCRIIDEHFYEDNADEESITIRSELILHLNGSQILKYYYILFIYNIRRSCPAIKGIHIAEENDSVNRYFNNMHKTADSMYMPAGGEAAANDCVRNGHIIYTIGGRNEIRYYNDDFGSILGYSSSDKLNYMDELIYAGNIEDIRREQRRQLQKDNTYQLRYRLKNRNGRPVSVIESGCCMTMEESSFVLNSVIIDIGPLKKINEHFLSSLLYDELTGIYNKETFYKKTRMVIAENSGISFEMMCVDIERFKVINEIFGEEIGNQLLRQIAECLRSTAVTPLVYGRLYADKFVLCYPAENDNRQRFMDILNKMAAAFRHNYKVILCFGVYAVSNRSINVSAMCDKANLALKKVKGRYFMTCGEYDETMHQRLIDEQGFINDMNKALTNREFLFYLQPKYELSTSRIIGAEALVRWLHPQKGFIEPNRFIPIFEENGFIFSLDKYIWEEVCKLLRRWLDEGRPIHPISVNISRVDLYSDELVGFLDELIKKYNIPARLLELELTESAYFNNPEQIVDITQKLQKMGFIILMDDFGSGYSSLNMLKDVNVNVLKVDLKFLQNTSQNNRSGRILNAVVYMAKCLELPIIIEGVETLQQSEFLQSIGCSWVQGYYYSRPIPVKDYEKLIDQMEYLPSAAELCPCTLPLQIEDFFDPNAKFNLLFNSITCGIGIYEFTKGNLRLLRANDSYFYIFKHSIKSFYALQDNVLDYVYEDDRMELLESIGKTCAENDVTHCHIRRYTSDGSLLHLLTHISCIVKENDYHIIYMALEEVSHQGSIYAEIQKIFDNIPAAFGIFELCDDELWARQVSRNFNKLTGYRKKAFMALTGGNMKNLLDEQNLDMLKKAILHAYEEKRTVILTEAFTTRTDKSIFITVSINAVKSNRETLLCYMYVHDGRSE